MNKINFIDKKAWILFIKGLLIGVSIIIPGISGGTMAIITGLYSSIIDALSSFRLIVILSKREFLKFWNSFSYLIPVLVGILLGFIVMARWIVFLIQSYPVFVYSFFSGIILASLPLLSKQMKTDWVHILIFLFSAILIFLFSFFDSLFFSGYFWLFFSIYLAVGAMLLPGVSGSYVLILMGTYSYVLEEISSLSWQTVLFLFVGGVSLITFSRFLKHLLANYLSKTMAFLTGMVLGGALGVFPIKSVVEFKTHGAVGILFLFIGVIFVIGIQIFGKIIRKRV